MSGTNDRTAVCAEADGGSEPADDRARAIPFRDAAINLALQGRFAESEACSREALRLRPDDVDVMNELGVAVWKQGREAEAEEILRRADRIKPDDFRVLTNLGLALMSQHRHEEAGECFRAAIRVRPDAFHARMNLGNVIGNRGDFDGAMEWLLSALEICPDSVLAMQNIATNLGRMGRWTEAIAYYERALTIEPEHPEVHRSLGYFSLAIGDYVRGWPEHEWRLKCPNHKGCRINRTFWNGDDFRDRTILLHFEQGYGDTLQFIRYARLVKRRGGRVVVLCQSPLVRLLSRCEGVDLAFDGQGFEPECHIQAPLMSLPSIFGTTRETIPAEVPYLRVDPAQVERWRPVVEGVLAASEDPGRAERPLRIGIAWQGSRENTADRWRSFPLEQLAPLAALPGVRLISLQVGHGTEQIAALRGRFPVIELPGRRGRDFSETAAIASLLDLVIAPCTAVTHLAGGLGLPVWTPLCSTADWRWLTDRDDCPWYPTMRLFRQPRLGDWESVFRRMADELGGLLARRAGGLTLAAGAA
jgi:Flp pilus assembly protein TadD